MLSLLLSLPQDILVSGYNTDTVHRFDLATLVEGANLGVVQGAQSAQYGPDGDLYVCSEKTGRVLAFDGTTLAFRDEFVADDPATPEDETGGLATPTGAVFGPDGDLYVGDFDGDCVLRYDGETGAFVGEFVAQGSGGLNGPDAGLAFGPDGDLYVPSYWSNRVLRYDGKSGALVETVLNQLDGLSRPRTVRFRSDGKLFVTSWGNNRILRAEMDGSDAVAFASVSRPTGLEFEPGTGDLIVCSDNSNAVRKYDGESGASLGALITSAASPIDGATFIALHPDPRLHSGRLEPGVAGQVNRLELWNGTPGSAHWFGFGLAKTSQALGPCPGEYLGVLDPFLAVAVADSEGRVAIEGFLAPSLAGVELWYQGFDPAACRLSTVARQTL